MKPNTVGCVGDNDRRGGQFSPFAALDTGLVQGALILTLDGEIPVEFLSVGDRTGRGGHPRHMDACGGGVAARAGADR